MDEMYVLIGIAIASFVTYASRFIPFLFFTSKKPNPFLVYIDKTMPLMIMVILVFYSIKNVSFSIYPYGYPELVSICLAVLLQLLFKKALLSIIISTICYMFMVQYLV